MADIEPLRLADDVRTWEEIRASSVQDLTDRAGDRWTDHNLTDPGITVLETAAFALADLEFRTTERDFGSWSLESSPWLAHDDHHWSGLPLATEPADRVAAADALANHLDVLTAVVLAADSRRTAISAVMAGSTERVR